MTDEEVAVCLKKNQIGMTVEEARKVEALLGRPPTLTEGVMWGIQGSEHCSYRSSRKYLKTLPTDAPNVILGPVEDAGIVEIARDGADRWGLVMSHESHNHPSQIVPYEGAATGVGGNVRDVSCMGAKVIGLMDPLRFGDPSVNASRIIANEAIRGIAGYGNPIGVPNLGGDIGFDEAFNSNCLVNVLTFGLVREKDIIHSHAPQEAAREGYDIIIVGKATDASGMGGAAFASVELNEEDKERNKGAVQEPNPFLKRHLLAANQDLFAQLKSMNRLHQVSFKDMGAGGNMCATVEQVAERGFGAEIDLEKIHVALPNLPPSVIAASETQERFAWLCHPDLTALILAHYNEKWELGRVAAGARASCVGKVKEGGQYVLWHKGQKVCDAKAKDITQGLRYERPLTPKTYALREPVINESMLDFNQILLDLLAAPNICSRHSVYNRYDKSVQGNTIIEAGEADAGVIAPLLEMEDVGVAAQKTAVAVSCDGVSRYSQISPYWQAANAAVESMRNVAAVGATPQALTDCLNYNNPENPEWMWELAEGIRGLGDACRGIHLKDHPGYATPVISGNVSLYNQVDATAIVGCAGTLRDFHKAITPQFKDAGNQLFLLGDRKNELGGGEFYHLLGHLGAHVPKADFESAEKEIHTVIDAIDQGLVVSCHDISEGGLLITLAEMTMPHPRKPASGQLGALIDLGPVAQELEFHQKAFSETGGFVVEVPPASLDAFQTLCQKNALMPLPLGLVTGEPDFTVLDRGKTRVHLNLSLLQKAFLKALEEKLR